MSEPTKTKTEIDYSKEFVDTFERMLTVIVNSDGPEEHRELIEGAGNCLAVLKDAAGIIAKRNIQFNRSGSQQYRDWAITEEQATRSDVCVGCGVHKGESILLCDACYNSKAAEPFRQNKIEFEPWQRTLPADDDLKVQFVPHPDLQPEPEKLRMVGGSKPTQKNRKQDVIELLVVDILNQHDYTASFEHPGYISVKAIEDGEWNIGRANENWGMDYCKDGFAIFSLELRDEAGFPIPSDSRDVIAIWQALEEILKLPMRALEALWQSSEMRAYVQETLEMESKHFSSDKFLQGFKAMFERFDQQH